MLHMSIYERRVGVEVASTLPPPSGRFSSPTIWTADAACKEDASRVSGVKSLSHSSDTIHFAETKAPERYDPFASQKIDTFQKSSNSVYRMFLLCSCPNCYSKILCGTCIQCAGNRDRKG
jgi:hypothetical protein